MADDPKWLVLLRDNKDAPWKPWGHKSGKRYEYGTIDKAIRSMKAGFFGKWRRGDAKVERVDRFDEASADTPTDI